MKGERSLWRAGRIRKPRLASIVKVFAIYFVLAIPGLAKANDLAVFGAHLMLPGNEPEGTVRARTFISPQRACGKSTCNFEKAVLWIDGGVYTTGGPRLETTLSGISTRAIINNEPVEGDRPIGKFSSPIEIDLIKDRREIKGGKIWGGEGGANND